MPWRDGLRSLRRGTRVVAGLPVGGDVGDGDIGDVGDVDHPVPAPGEAVTRADVEAVLADPRHIRMDFQPILDVRSARTAGWEVLARFDGRCVQAPDLWFAAAHRHGLGIALEAVTVRRALSALRVRTPGTFISVNVSPAALDDPLIVDLIAASAPLSGLVVEVTEHTTPPPPGLGPWHASCRRLHELGAMIAIDDIGKGYAEMLQILQLHPQIIKIDKEIVASVSDDPAHRALLRFLGLFADEIDAWLLAEGVETPAQLAALQALGVPLAQGWLVGAPDGVPRPCRREVTTVAGLPSTGRGPRPARPPVSAAGPDAGTDTVPDAATGTATEAGTDNGTEAGTDTGTDAGTDAGDGRTGPGGVTTVAQVMSPQRGSRAAWAPTALRVPADLPLVEAARRALTRPTEHRYEPLQCLDASGRVIGELTMHDLFLAVVGPGTPPRP